MDKDQIDWLAIIAIFIFSCLILSVIGYIYNTDKLPPCDKYITYKHDLSTYKLVSNKESSSKTDIV